MVGEGNFRSHIGHDGRNILKTFSGFTFEDKTNNSTYGKNWAMLGDTYIRRGGADKRQARGGGGGGGTGGEGGAGREGGSGGGGYGRHRHRHCKFLPSFFVCEMRARQRERERERPSCLLLSCLWLWIRQARSLCVLGAPFPHPTFPDRTERTIFLQYPGLSKYTTLIIPISACFSSELRSDVPI